MSKPETTEEEPTLAFYRCHFCSHTFLGEYAEGHMHACGLCEAQRRGRNIAKFVRFVTDEDRERWRIEREQPKTRIKLWVLRSVDGGTTFETVDTTADEPNIEMLFDPRDGTLLDTIYRPAFFALPPGKFRVLTEVDNHG